MIYKIKMNKEDYFKLNNKIVSANLEIDGEEVTFDVEGGSYHILKKSKYKYKLIESFQTKVVRFLSKNILLIVGVLFLLSILYINTYRVEKIAFNRQTPINDEIEYRISSSFKRLFCFDFCNLDYEDFSKRMRLSYPEYPYISVTCANNIISVDIYNYDDVNYPSHDDKCGDIIAVKDGIVDSFYVYNGQSNVEKNKYVKEGDVLISGNLETKFVKAGGLVMATTYDKVTLSIPKKEQTEILGDEKDDYYQFKLFNMELDIGKKNRFSLPKRTTSVLFNMFDWFQVKKIEDVEKNVIIKTYTLEEAEQEARCRIEDAFNDQKSSDLEKIMAMAATKQEETEDSYVFTYIVKKYESIGVFQEYEE